MKCRKRKRWIKIFSWCFVLNYSDKFINYIDKPTPPTFIEKYIEEILGLIAFTLSGISFIILGFYLNYMNKNRVKYWKYLIIGATTSFLSATIFFLAMKYNQNIMEFRTTWSVYLSSVMQHIFLIPLITLFLIIVCSIVALFHKYFKYKKNTDNLKE